MGESGWAGLRHPTSCGELCPWRASNQAETQAAYGHCLATWLLASLLPPVAMVTPVLGGPPGPEMLGLISLSPAGSGGDRMSQQGLGVVT